MKPTIFLFLSSIMVAVRSEVPLNGFFPFGPSNGDATMVRSDDGSSPQISISTMYRFFGLNQTFLWVNVNGAISFKSIISSYTPTCGPMTAQFSMIGPYWADVDIRTTGEIYYRESKNPRDLQQANAEIHNAYPEMEAVNMTWTYIVTWYNVTYYMDIGDQYDATRKRNFFQAILTTDEKFSYAIFYYNQMLWTTGDASGGHGGLGGSPAKAGFDAGNGKDLFMIPTSCTGDINTTLVTNSNVGKPGVWVFAVADAVINTPPPHTLPPTTTTTPAVTTQYQVHTTRPPVHTTVAPTLPPSPLSNSDGTPCNCNKPTMWLDLIVVADKSKSVGLGGLGSIGAQLATALYGVNIAQSGSDFYTRVGLVLFSSDVQVLADLQKYNSYMDLVTDLENLESYHSQNDPTVDIYAGLKQANSIFQSQSDANPNRKARKVVLLIASSYNQVGNNNPVTLAAQMNQSDIFIITIDYNDVDGAATQLLSQISTPFQNFTSSDQGGLKDTFTEVSQALCYANCICPSATTQLVTYNATSGRSTYFSDCYAPYLSGAFAIFAEAACKEVKGTLVSLQTSSKTAFVLNQIASRNGTKLMSKFHTGLHRDTTKNWVWYGYQNTTFPLGHQQNWMPGFSVTSAGDCSFIEQYDGSNWGWGTENCIGQNPYPYICQIRACDSTYGTCDCKTWKNDPSCSSS